MKGRPAGSKGQESNMAFGIIVLFVAITIWWLLIHPLDPESVVHQKHIWSSSYMVLSLLGGIFGITISNHWGGYKSVIGKSILAFSIGLLLQSFGQIVYNYYTLFLKIEAPYPSLGDLGYFGSIAAYIYGVLLLGRASGLKVSIKSLGNQLLSIILPILMLVGSYLIFLKGYEIDPTHPLTTFLDFGYPLGQAIYVSIAVLVLVVSRNFLGGVMKRPIILLLIALIVQYVCDFNFLYRAAHGLWYAGGVGDYLYSVSYFLMTIALLYIGNIFQKIKES